MEDKKTKAAEKAAEKTFEELIREEIARNEEYVEAEFFKDNDKYKDDIFVSVGNETCVVKRGVPVRIKRKFALVIEQQRLQDIMTARLIEAEQGKSNEAAVF